MASPVASHSSTAGTLVKACLVRLIHLFSKEKNAEVSDTTKFNSIIVACLKIFFFVAFIFQIVQRCNNQSYFSITYFISQLLFYGSSRTAFKFFCKWLYQQNFFF